MNYYERHLGDYARDTAHLSMLEHGAYNLLLDRYYASEAPIPADQAHRVARARSAEERKAVDAVLAEFFTLQDGVYAQKRVQEEIDLFCAKTGAAKKNGSRGGASRWDSPQAKAKETRAQRLAAAREKGKHTDQQWRLLVEACGNQCVKCKTPAAELIGGSVCKDHIVPIYQGGSDGLDNLQPMCRPCNTGKGPDTTDHRPSDWRITYERLAKRLPESQAEGVAETGKRLTLQAPSSNHQTPEEGSLRSPSGAREATETQRVLDSRETTGLEKYQRWQADHDWALKTLPPIYPTQVWPASDWQSACRTIAGILETGEVTRADLERLARDFATQQTAMGNAGTKFVEKPQRHYNGDGRWKGPFLVPVKVGDKPEPVRTWRPEHDEAPNAQA